MRQVLSISLPEVTVNSIKTKALQRGFGSVSEYIKNLVNMDEDLITQEELLGMSKRAEKEYLQGKTVRSKSLADFL